jgi:rare lipoprotein A
MDAVRVSHRVSPRQRSRTRDSSATSVACVRSAAVCLWAIAALAHGAALPPAQEGLASVYSKELNGKRTASGEPYGSRRLTAAHRSLPLGTTVKVTNLGNGKSVRVRINDRGPHVRGRIIDLSSGAAAALGFRTGVARVRIEILSLPVHTGEKTLPRAVAFTERSELTAPCCRRSAQASATS